MLLPDTVKQLREDFPRDSIETKRVGNFTQTGYQAQYIIERLNDIFGHDSWRAYIIEERETSKFAGAKVTLEILNWKLDNEGAPVPPPAVIITRTQWGTCEIEKENIFDAKKGAITNAICKCASMLDIGHKAYKGLLEPVAEEKPAEIQSPTINKNKGLEEHAKELEYIKDLCKTKGITSIAKLRELLGLKFDNIQTLKLVELKEISKKLAEWQPEKK